MSKDLLVNWLKEQQPILEKILLTSAEEYYNNYSSKRNFFYDVKKTGEELWLLSRGGDLCYDRPTIGFNYSLWYHPKRINTFLSYFTDLIYDARNEGNIQIFDLGAGTGAVLWAVGLVVQGLKHLQLPCPNVRVVNIDTSAFMLIYNYRYLWKNFITEYPLAEEISQQSDYRLNSWSNVDEAAYSNIWLCASYLFDNSENESEIAKDFKEIINNYKPNKILLLTSSQDRKVRFCNLIAQEIQTLNYSNNIHRSQTIIYSGPLNLLYQFRNDLSTKNNLGLSGVPKWNIDSLYGKILINNAPQLGLDFNNLNLFIGPESNRAKIKMTPQQTEAAELNDRPTLIIGPAGCGKSVVLTQKIKNIVTASKIGENYNPSIKILVTTFNKGLVRFLGNWIEQLLEPGKFTRSHETDFYGRQTDHSYFRFSGSPIVNIYVMHFDILPTKIGKLHTFNIALNGNNFEDFHFNKMNDAVLSYLAIHKINRSEFEKILSPEFLLDEYQRVIYGFECTNENAYQTLERTGRGNNPQLRFNSKRRKIVWGINRLYLKDLHAKQLESFIIRRHRLIKKLRSQPYQNKFTHIIVDEFQDCTKADYEIFYQLLRDPNNITLAGDIAQSINLGAALHIPRADDARMGNFTKKKLEGSFRLPFRVSECIKPLSIIINEKFGVREGIESDIINPYKGAPPGSRPIFAYADDTTTAAVKISDIFNAFKGALKLDKVTIFERDVPLLFELKKCNIPSETEIILRTKGLEKNCVLWSSRINVDSNFEKEEFIYTILTRTVSLLIILVFPETQQDFLNIIKLLVPDRLMRWDEESETKYNELMQSQEDRIPDVDNDNSEENQTVDEETIDGLIV
jgi:DNA helicase-2/ATP-dependent DNA helicase PcrA